METSFYQSLKLDIIKLVDLSKDAIHVHIGLVVFFVAVLLWKKGKITASCIFPVLVLAFGMEAMDLFDDYRSVGYMRWLNSAHDIINTILWPLLIVLFFKIRLVSAKNL